MTSLVYSGIKLDWLWSIVYILFPFKFEPNRGLVFCTDLRSSKQFPNSENLQHILMKTIIHVTKTYLDTTTNSSISYTLHYI